MSLKVIYACYFLSLKDISGITSECTFAGQIIRQMIPNNRTIRTIHVMRTSDRTNSISNFSFTTTFGIWRDELSSPSLVSSFENLLAGSVEPLPELSPLKKDRYWQVKATILSWSIIVLPHDEESRPERRARNPIDIALSSLGNSFKYVDDIQIEANVKVKTFDLGHASHIWNLELPRELQFAVVDYNSASLMVPMIYLKSFKEVRNLSKMEECWGITNLPGRFYFSECIFMNSFLNLCMASNAECMVYLRSKNSKYVCVSKDNL